MKLNRRRRPRINGTCIAGTPAHPRDWWRVKDGLAFPMHGRYNPSPAGIAAGGIEAFREFLCEIKQDRPIRGCETCPAYRHRPSGRDGMGPTGEPLSLTPAEYEMWMDDELYAFKDRGGLAVSTLARDPDNRFLYDDVGEYHAEQARQWRAAHPGADKRKRKRDRAAYMREYRKRNPVGINGLARAEPRREND